MRIPIICFSFARKEEFVDFWSALYKDKRERLYFDNIGHALTAERVESLYHWKCGDRFWEPQRRDVERNVIDRLDELKQLDKDCPPADFLLRFGRLGPIWSIFLLHIWQPDRYAIYDQHTHRAMRFIPRSLVEERPANYEAVARTYVNDYLPFFRQFPRRPDRRVDKALFAFGKFLKSPLGQRAAAADRRQGG